MSSAFQVSLRVAVSAALHCVQWSGQCTHRELSFWDIMTFKHWLTKKTKQHANKIVYLMFCFYKKPQTGFKKLTPYTYFTWHIFMLQIFKEWLLCNCLCLSLYIYLTDLITRLCKYSLSYLLWKIISIRFRKWLISWIKHSIFRSPKAKQIPYFIPEFWQILAQFIKVLHGGLVRALHLLSHGRQVTMHQAAHHFLVVLISLLLQVSPLL